MNIQEKRKMVCDIAWSYIGTPYKWGGDDFSGFDCSGLAIECLKSVNCLPRKGDWRARDLASMFEKVGRQFVEPADLVFWANTQGIVIHVEIMLNDEVSIGASGGGSATLTEEDAVAQNAFIKIRPVDSRAGLYGFVNPFKKKVT